MRDLTVREVAALRAPGAHRVSRNLYLRIQPGARGGVARSWVFRYLHGGRARHLGLGPYDLVTLAQARDRVIDLRRQLQAGVDPLAAQAQRRQGTKALTFQQCAERYIAAHAPTWRNPKHRAQWPSTLASYVYPVLGATPAAQVDVGQVLAVIEPLWRTKPETATRVRGRIETVLDWATARGYRTGDNPARWRGHLDQILPKRAKVRAVRHQPAMPYVDVPAFMAQLRERTSTSARALELTILTAARTSEVIGARWAEIDMEAGIWTVPAERMKSHREHRVPLSGRAVEILRELPRVDDGALVLPGARAGRPLSNMAMLELLRGMVGREFTVHGFRSAFRDWAAEQTSFPAEIAEAALAHILKDKTQAAYQRGDLLKRRQQLMEAWARYCATPRADGEVVPITAKRRVQ